MRTSTKPPPEWPEDVPEVEGRSGRVKVHTRNQTGLETRDTVVSRVPDTWRTE